VPKEHSASRSLRLTRSSDEVREVIANVAGGAGWRDGVTLVEKLGHEKTLDAYLRSLARRLGESAEPGPAAAGLSG
jgi:hypothetical protein